jgi:hypothetical protein
MDADVCDKDHNPTIVTQLLQLETESHRTIYGAFPYASGSLLTPRRKALLLNERAARLGAESEAKFPRAADRGSSTRSPTAPAVRPVRGAGGTARARAA